jgi:uncharacterized membrane protein
MQHTEFINQLEEQRIVTAIANAEHQCSGEIRLFISSHKVTDPLTAAQAQFAKLGMHKTKHRNGVLIYLAPVTQNFAIVGDAGIHEKCGDAFWQEVSAIMTDHLRRGQYTTAIIEAIQKTAQLLARHFPRDPDDRNELPNEIVRD